MDREDAFRRALPLEPGRTALLVVDMQRAFVEPGQAMEVPPAREVVPRIQELLAIFREKGLPVVFTEFTYSPAAPLLVGELHPEHRPAAAGAATGFGRPSSSCLEGEDNVAVIPELAPHADELVVRKHYYDGFNGTVLDGALRARGVTTVVITGTMTDICVLATVIGAFNREYRLVVVEDAVATLWPEIQRATLDIVRRAYARVLSAKELADEVARW
ncbi:MAG TPA: isochorismatase family cysteine hydrolase [Candidatus Dormibacteraeota bacterium]|nr:isochorismatase family cysteine hydrolase [Candidatus Dormibacteraeota bacterium]